MAASPLQVMIALGGLGVSSALGGAAAELAEVPGASASSLTDPIERAGKAQHWAWWSGDRWDAVLPTSSGWRLYTDLTGDMAQGAVVDNRQAARVDTLWHDGSVWVLRGHASTPQITRYDLNGSYAAAGAVTNVTISALAADDGDLSPVVLYRTPNGALWAAVNNGSNVVVARSVNSGQSWTSASVLSVSATGAVMLTHSGDTLVLISMQNDSGGRAVRTIDQGAGSISSGNWASESLPALPAGIGSDDHGMAATVDGHIYVASKTDGSVDSSTPLLYLLHRDPSGVWSQRTLVDGPDGVIGSRATRPHLLATPSAVTVAYGQIGGRRDAHLLELPRETLGEPDRDRLMAVGNFSDGVVPPREVVGESGILWLAHDRDTGAIVRQWMEPTEYVDVCGDGGAVEPIVISRGRTDESNAATPARAEFTLRNDDGRYSPRNPLGPYYGRLGLNTRVRVAWGGRDRFQGFMSESPTTWPGVVEVSRVPVRADGPLRRLDQGQDPLQSAITRHMTRRRDVIAYWSCEEESTAGRVSSPIPGVAPFTPSANVGFAAIDGPGGSGRVLRVPAEAHTVRGRVPPHEPTSRYVYQHVFRQDEPEAEGAPRTCMTVFLSTPSVRAWRLRTSAEDFIVEVRDSDGELTTSSSQDTHPDYFGRWLRIVLELDQNGSNLGWRATVLTADADARQLQQLSGSISNTQLGRVMQCGLLFGTSGPPDRFVGNMSLTRDGSLADHAPWHGYVGETAAERILRLCGEEGLTCTIVGEPAATARMGSQRPDTLLGVFRDCELTDGGRFGDGLTYRTRMSMLNQEPVIALGRTDLVDSVSTEDDRHVRNDVTATGRSSGATGRFVDEASVKAVGRYTDSITVNPEHDHDLQNLASWRAHMGSVDEMRWPAMSISPLRRRPDGSDLVDEWLALRPGDRITAHNCFPQLPGLDIDVIVEGWTETLRSEHVRVDLNCGPYAPWRVFQFEHPVLGRLYPDSAVLGSAVDSSATSWTVVTVGPPWITTDTFPGQFPFEVTVGGEVVQVTGISAPTGQAQNFTVVRAVNGVTKAHPVGSRLDLYPGHVLA